MAGAEGRRVVSTGLIDAHHHVWGANLSEYPFLDRPGFDELRRPFGIDELADEARAYGVVGTVVVEARELPDETNSLLSIAKANPLVAGVIGWESILAPDLSSRLAELRAQPDGDKLVGVRVRLRFDPAPSWILGPAAARGLEAIAAAGLSLDLLVEPTQLGVVRELARRFDSLRIVVDHLAFPALELGRIDEGWCAGVAELAGLDNVAAKLSGLVTHASGFSADPAHLLPVVRHAFDVFGADRIILGSDWPICLLAAPYADVLDTYLQLVDNVMPEARSAIASDNAARIYRLRIPARSG